MIINNNNNDLSVLNLCPGGALTHVVYLRTDNTKVRDAKPLDRQIVAAIEPRTTV